jgi:hypothetical protein
MLYAAHRSMSRHARMLIGGSFCFQILDEGDYQNKGWQDELKQLL